MIANRRLDGWTVFFLTTTVATSMTGFGFPIQGMTPGIAIGSISLAVLAVAIYARYPRHLSGLWCRVYVVGALFAFYLNFVVLIVQSFQKVPALHALAPNQTEPPFVAAQLVSLVAFLILGTSRGEALSRGSGRSGRLTVEKLQTLVFEPLFFARRSDTPTRATASTGKEPIGSTPKLAHQTAEDDRGKAAVRFLARSKRGTSFRTTSLLGGTERRRRRICTRSPGRDQGRRRCWWRFGGARLTIEI